MAKQKPKSTNSNKKPLPSNDSPQSNWSFFSILKFLFTFATVVFLWFGHYKYLFTLFENDRFFSHLSDIEREMSYRTEMGLYFSYYKTLVDAPSFVDGIYSITHDNITEAGHTINTLERFNLYPELYLGWMFRVFRGISSHFKMEWQSCYHIRRGNDLPPVTSCEGIGNMHYFYMYGVFIIAGTVLPAIFLMGKFLSNNYFGGVASAVAFIVNHGHATRVQWTPPLRESFGYPVFCLQICLLTWMLKQPKICKWSLSVLTFLTTHFILFWQLSGFVLFTQIACLFCTYILGYLSIDKLKSLLFSYIISFGVSFGLLFGNLMLLSSLFFTSLVAIFILIVFQPLLIKFTNRFTFLLINLTFFLLFTFSIKFMMNNIFGIHDDSHVFDILRSKFTSYSDFHTSLYTCAAEFDFVDVETLKSISQTGLLPLASISLLITSIAVLKNLFSPSQLVENKNFLPVVFNAGQLVCFCIIAGLIMRLKLFGVPHLCVFLPVIFNQEVQLILFKRRIPWLNALVIVYIALLAFQGQQNIQKQLSVQGEFNNESQERLFIWINENTHKNAVFSGSMSLMANVKLSTLRPIFNHPHYENQDIRDRTMKAYSIYSRKDPHDVHKLFKSLKINYFIFETQHCGQHPKPECTYLGMWDRVDKANQNKVSICSKFVGPIENGNNYEKLKPFKVVYNSYNYAILEV